MKKEYILGREKENDIVINKPMISQPHLKIVLEDDKHLLITDLNSTNKTFVNDRQIFSKIFTKNDSLSLGSYKLDVPILFKTIKKKQIENKKDFSKEFAQLEIYYNDFESKKEKIKKTYRLKPLLIRSGLTIAVMISVFLAGEALAKYRYFLVMGVGMIGGFFATMGVDNKKLNLKIDELDIEFGKKYICPKCGYKFSVNKSWRKWAADKSCPNNKCDASW